MHFSQFPSKFNGPNTIQQLQIEFKIQSTNCIPIIGEFTEIAKHQHIIVSTSVHIIASQACIASPLTIHICRIHNLKDAHTSTHMRAYDIFHMGMRYVNQMLQQHLIPQF